eukprot:RCo008676
MGLKVLALGAGRDVGRSCVLVSIGGRTLMFDCGVHMGYRDSRKYPDFASLGSSEILGARGGDLSRAIDAVFVTHFHLDHCGALPYFTERWAYSGPVFMSYPT